MKLRRFFGPSAREALREVKRELGAEAMIVSNRAVEGGVEILAVPASELEAAGAAPRTPEQSGAGEAAQAGDPTRAILAEIGSLRSALEAQLALFAWNDALRREPMRARLAAQLLAAGVSAALARQLTERLPAGLNSEQAAQWVREVLARNLRTAPCDDIVTRGGVYALLGPTGVGKTTTAAKLAARAVVRWGPDRIALLTTDSYRIGGHEQLRVYARILGVPMYVVSDAEDLRIALHEFRDKHLVLIDTVGAGQRDRMVAEQLKLLGTAPRLGRLLVLSAAAAAETLEDVVRGYGREPLAGSIVTKVDEAVALGGVLDVAIRNRLLLHYIADGQRVPEDLHVADSVALVRGALRCSEPPFGLREEELVLASAARASAPSGVSHAALG